MLLFNYKTNRKTFRGACCWDWLCSVPPSSEAVKLAKFSFFMCGCKPYFFEAHLDDVTWFLISSENFQSTTTTIRSCFALRFPEFSFAERFGDLCYKFIFFSGWRKLMFLLNQKRKNFINWGKQLHKHDTRVPLNIAR